MMMSAAKPVVKSLTVWGAVATVIVAVGSILGWDVDDATVREVIEALAVAAGGLITIIGRIRARTEITR